VTPRILVSAGEPSGDLHGGPVVRALRARWPDAQIDAFGGTAMAAAGATVLWPMDRYTVMGFAEVLGKVPAHYRLLREFRARFRAGAYDLVLLIDYPGFHLRVAESARKSGVRVLHYIAPQLWAWNPGRAKRLAAAVDRFAVIFPFEEPFLRGLGLDARYVGHPLMDRGDLIGRDEARRRLGLTASDRVVALFPGSRNQELHRHWVAFRDAGLALARTGQVDRVLVATVPGKQYPGSSGVELVAGQSDLVLAAADAALIKSGTSALEAAVADVPMVVAYRLHPLTAWFARRVMRVRWIGLVNLILDTPAVPECLQEELTAERLVTELAPLVDRHNPAALAQRAAFAEVRRRLGGPGAAERVVDMAAELLP